MELDPELDPKLAENRTSEVQKRRVVVVGLGYVGLPLAARAVEVGHEVVGFDVNTARVGLLASGRSFVDDVSDADIAAALGSGRFAPTADPSLLSGFDVAVVTVPTPLRDGAPDLRHVEDAARVLAPHVRKGCCVVLESTTYPGSTEDIFVPLLEAGSGLTAGRDFRVGYSPERIDPSNRTWGFRNTPKLVSGIDDESAEAVAGFYAKLVDRVVPVSGTREAELAKLLENTFRHVNIALVNELAIFCNELGIDVWSVLDAAATKPFGFMRFVPGPGVGGHCLPIDPSYLSWQVRRSLGRTFRFVEIANDVNDHMPDYVVDRVTAHLNSDKKPVNGSTILLLGLTYKANSRDARNSPAMMVADRLLKLGANLLAADPHLEAADVPAGIALVDCTDEQLSAADLIVVLTDHDALDWSAVERHASRVFDTRNRLASRATDRL
jgi:UDP-N-acetyl-D-mannosaminuronic acid dehydrogenase/UDP-N-acetyl-D-glucosamine dehydrogenase